MIHTLEGLKDKIKVTHLCPKFMFPEAGISLFYDFLLKANKYLKNYTYKYALINKCIQTEQGNCIILPLLRFCTKEIAFSNLHSVVYDLPSLTV